MKKIPRLADLGPGLRSFVLACFSLLGFVLLVVVLTTRCSTVFFAADRAGDTSPSLSQAASHPTRTPPDPAKSSPPGASSADRHVPATLFDLPATRDASTADCRFDNQHDVVQDGVALTAWHLSYLSWEYVDGALRPIRIRAFVARPKAGTARLPAVVQAHGLGGEAEPDSANVLAARLGMYALAFSGPGSGTTPDSTSEGRPSSFGSGYQMFDTRRDVRGSWFWAHTQAALRALTCLQTRSDVDGGRLGMTGFSAGAVASLLAAQVDDRVSAVVPLSGSLAWREAVRSEAAWEHGLLAQSHLTLASPEWDFLNRDLLDRMPTHAPPATKVFMINGSTDEFFPLTAHKKTLQALASHGGSPLNRTSIIGNYDHGCYRQLPPAEAEQVGLRARLQAEGGQRAWFRHYLAADPLYPSIPKAPQVSTFKRGGKTVFAAVVDKGSGLDLHEVRLWWSSDRSYHYDNLLMTKKSATRYEKETTVTPDAATIYFVDAQYQTREQPTPHAFSLSSEPVIPADLIPHIRVSGACQ